MHESKLATGEVATAFGGSEKTFGQLVGSSSVAAPFNWQNLSSRLLSPLRVSPLVLYSLVESLARV